MFTSRHLQGLVWVVQGVGGRLRVSVPSSHNGVTFIFLEWFGKVVFIIVLSVVDENG